MKIFSVGSFRIFLAVIVAGLVLSGLNVYHVSAQDESESFQDVQLWIYPEYDDPRLLVMLEGQVSGIQPPAEVRFLVPSTAEMYSAGSMDAQGNYSGGPPDRKASGIPGWDEISYQLQTDTFRVEYYDPIILGKPEKSISYDFRCLYPISDIEVIVQEPQDSTNFTVLPAGQAFAGNAGFAAYRYSYSNLVKEDTLEFEISYYREAVEPSISGESSESTDYTLLIILVAVLAVALVGWLVWSRRSAPATRAERRRSSRKSPARPKTKKQTGARFCDQCGNPVDSGYKYCPNCGNEL